MDGEVEEAIGEACPNVRRVMLTGSEAERLPGGAMGGVMIHDSRDPKTSATYLAARGVVTEVDGSTRINGILMTMLLSLVTILSHQVI